MDNRFRFEFIGAITFPAANLDAISRSYKLHVQYSRYDIWIDFIAFLVFVGGGWVGELDSVIG